MSKSVGWFIAVLGCGLLAGIGYFVMPKSRPEPVVQSAPPVTPPSAVPAIRYPVAPQPVEKPLPPLDVSDTTIQNALEDLPLDAKFIALFQWQGFLRRVVATIDNLPREKLALRLLPMKRVDGKFLVSGKDETLAINADNAARYALYLQLADAIDTQQLVALYVHFYPLFQQAYQELGYPQGYFNDRLIDVIDHLLAAPEVNAPILLAQPKVFYVFADPALEALSAGQKLLIRMGRANAAQIKAKLRDIRDALGREALKR